MDAKDESSASYITYNKAWKRICNQREKVREHFNVLPIFLNSDSFFRSVVLCSMHSLWLKERDSSGRIVDPSFTPLEDALTAAVKQSVMKIFKENVSFLDCLGSLDLPTVPGNSVRYTADEKISNLENNRQEAAELEICAVSFLMKTRIILISHERGVTRPRSKLIPGTEFQESAPIYIYVYDGSTNCPVHFEPCCPITEAKVVVDLLNLNGITKDSPYELFVNCGNASGDRIPERTITFIEIVLDSIKLSDRKKIELFDMMAKQHPQGQSHRERPSRNTTSSDINEETKYDALKSSYQSRLREFKRVEIEMTKMDNMYLDIETKINRMRQEYDELQEQHRKIKNDIVSNDYEEGLKSVQKEIAEVQDNISSLLHTHEELLKRVENMKCKHPNTYRKVEQAVIRKLKYSKLEQDREMYLKQLEEALSAVQRSYQKLCSHREQVKTSCQLLDAVFKLLHTNSQEHSCFSQYINKENSKRISLHELEAGLKQVMETFQQQGLL